MTPLKMREEIEPERFEHPLEDPLPSAKQAIRLEIYRQKGCEVKYNVPRWVHEEREQDTDFEKYFVKRPLHEYLLEIPRTKTKKDQLAKKYVILPKK